MTDWGFRSIDKISFKIISMCKRVAAVGLSQRECYGLRPQSKKLTSVESLESFKKFLCGSFFFFFCLFTFGHILKFPHLEKIMVDATFSEIKYSNIL